MPNKEEENSSDSVMHLVPQWPIYKYPTQPYTAAAAAVV